MTIEIVSLLKEKAITASDDAVTVNKTKAWTGARKNYKGKRHLTKRKRL